MIFGTLQLIARTGISSEETPLELATFGGGCFWCTEAVFQQIEGVESVVSGYSGGRVKNPTYKQVCTGRTGHAEVIQIRYNPEVVSYEKLLQIHWMSHDPTTRNRQGNDIGPQYRSVIFYHNDQQRELANLQKRKLTKSKTFEKPIVTTIEPFKEFYPAEKYHQDYFEQNRQQPYCSLLIQPKVEKIRKLFADDIKSKE
jgi:peptide-methionine (S)-S-oxide reductase